MRTRLVDAADTMLPIFAQHVLWRQKAREVIGTLMEARDRERLREELNHGVRLANSLGLDVSDVRMLAGEMRPVVRASVWTLAIVGVSVGLLLWARNWSETQIGFMGLKVVNDTPQTVRVQPCWDATCEDTIGLHGTLLGPGHASRVAGQWPNDNPELITLGVLETFMRKPSISKAAW